MSKKGFTYELKIKTEIDDLIAKTKTVKDSMQSIMDAGKAPDAKKIFGNIEKAIERLQAKTAQPITSISAFQGLEKDAASVITSLNQLGTVIDKLTRMSNTDKMDLIPSGQKKQIEDAEKALDNFAKAQSQASQKSQELIAAEKELASALKQQKAAEGKVSKKKAFVDLQQQAVDSARAEAKAINNKIAALEKYQSTYAAYEAAGVDKRMAGEAGGPVAGLSLPADRAAAAKAMRGTGIDIDLKNLQSVEDAVAQLKAQYHQAQKAITAVNTTQQKYSTQLNEANNAFTIASNKVKDLQGNYDSLNKEFEDNKALGVQKAYTLLRSEAERLTGSLTSLPVQYTEENFNSLREVLNQFAINSLANVDNGLNALQADMQQTASTTDLFSDKMIEGKEAVEKLDATVSETSALTERIKQFVGLQGGIQLARAAMRNAVETIKELDAAMTEMSVVTELEVGDYWEQLPEYTERAKDLGVSIKSAYESATLFYQQGLKTNEVVAMSNETLKMMRIAGLSAEDATNKMTAALRGFNMELNETSAQRVSDVYSELAAITASDVDEISSAMTKTASIAASAGMQFETTAAFLSQIIETTRESAETAGTALKTVIARFQELKKDPAEIGEVDGEIVDANKIETALRSVGVSLRDTSGQFRELDEVFLELAGKWGSLDTNTQRYIATIAAGSRQQSRFIAMMSDYGRTVELVEAANTSAGASNEQFEKTLDSLQSKLNNLKSAWDSFTMGIMNSEVLKAGIQIITSIMSAINKITDSFGKFSGAAKIGMLIAALQAGDKALAVFNRSIKESGSIFKSMGAVGRAALSSIQEKYIALKKLFTSKLNIKIGTKELYEATQASKAYALADQKLKSVEDARSEAMRHGNLTTERSAILTEEAKIATEQRNAAEQELMATMGLSATQMSAVQALESLGVSTGSALILTKSGITAANVEMIASLQGMDAAYAGNVMAEKLSNASGLRLLSTKLSLTIANWANNASEKAALNTRWKSITATIAQKAANWALQASMTPLLIITLALVAAIAVLALAIWGIVAAIKAIKANSPAGQLKSAEEAAEAAAEAASKAAESYNTLADSFDNLADKYSALEELTRGTQEWRDAVTEINDQILQLIQDYPELAALVKSENGVLSIEIDSKEAQTVLRKYQQKVSETANASLAAEINKNEKKAAYEATKMSRNVYIAGSEYASLTAATTQALANAMQSGEIRDLTGNGNADEIAAWLRENGVGNEIIYAEELSTQLSEITDDLMAFGGELRAMSEQQRIYTEQMAQNAIDLIDATKYSEDQLKQMDVAATADYAQAFIDKFEQDYSSGSRTAKQDARLQVAQSLYGEDAKVRGRKIIYEDEDGKRQTKKLTDEEFKEQWAAIEATEEMSKALEQLPKTITKISSLMEEAAGKAFKNMYADEEGLGMTKADVAAAREARGSLSSVWEKLEDIDKIAYGTFENFQAQFNSTLQSAQHALSQAEEAAARAGIETMSDISIEAARGYAEKMRNVYLVHDDSLYSLDNNLRLLIQNLNDTDKTKFMSALNALDWSNIDSLESLPDTLEEIGVNVPADHLDLFIKHLIDVGQATKTINLDKLREAIAELANIKKGLLGGDQGRVFSESAYKALVEMIPELTEQFQLGLDGQYVYLGASMDMLTKAIDENTSVSLRTAADQLTDKLTMAELTDTLTLRQDGSLLNFNKILESGNETLMRQALQTLQDEMAARGAEIIGIDGFSLQTPVSKFDKNELERVIGELLASAGSKASYENQLKVLAPQIAAINYQAQTATKNAQGLGLGAYDSLEEAQQTEFTSRVNAIAGQVGESETNQVLLDQYLKIVDAYKQGKAEYSEVLEIQNKLANAHDYTVMRNGLVEVFESIASVREEYNQLAEGDLKGKIMVVNKALQQFGLSVDETVGPDKYMEILDQIAQGSTEAVAKLVQFMHDAAVQSGELSAGLGNPYTKAWDTLSKEQIAFLDKMQAANLGMWENLADGSRQFVWATAEELQSLAEIAGSVADAWENPYDWLYNHNEEINKLIRERERLERKYTRALEEEGTTLADLEKIGEQQLANLAAEATQHTQGIVNAKAEIQSALEKNSRFSKYVGYDSATNKLSIDYDALDTANLSAEDGDAFEEFVSILEENRDAILDAEESLYDIEDEVKEIQEQGLEATSELYNKIKEGLIKTSQDEIDNLQSINDSIQEANTSLIEQMQKQIDETRKTREQQKTATEIADKQAKLAYLMQDTSGSNALEIAALQKEISEQEQDYTDALIDQSLQSLQDANEQAAEQRQQQIDLAQSALDAYAESQQIWKDVQAILDSSLAQARTTGDFAKNWGETQAAALINTAEGVDKLNPVKNEQLKAEILKLAGQSAIYTALGNSRGTVIEAVQNGLKWASAPAVPEKIADVQQSAVNRGLLTAGEYLGLVPNNLKPSTEKDYSNPLLTSLPIWLRIKNSLSPYASGGIADFTGPAWLDGTKSKPEIVLNQTDTANFIQLRDILADILNGTSNIAKTGEGSVGTGNNYYDIEINVDSLGDDYDVEQLADKIRRMIYEDSTYRNVNTINNIR